METHVTQFGNRAVTQHMRAACYEKKTFRKITHKVGGGGEFISLLKCPRKCHKKIILYNFFFVHASVNNYRFSLC